MKGLVPPELKGLIHERIKSPNLHDIYEINTCREHNIHTAIKSLVISDTSIEDSQELHTARRELQQLNFQLTRKAELSRCLDPIFHESILPNVNRNLAIAMKSILPHQFDHELCKVHR